MSELNSTLTHARIRELLHYDPDTGCLTWTAAAPRKCRGKRAGRPSLGYINVGIDGKTYQAHRVAWFYMTGEWPNGSIDHINGRKADNRWANLRDIPQKQNMQNQRRPRIGSRSGLLGVKWDECCQRWVARICVEGRQIYLGRSKDKTIAAAMYIAAKRAVHGAGTLEPADA